MVGLVVGATALTGCTGATQGVPGCHSGRRLAVVAQSVPSAAYVPCIDTLDEGWSSRAFEVRNGHTRFVLVPNRAGGRSVEVTFAAACDVTGAVPTTPRADGVRTAIRLLSISPRYAGTLSDVFPGGCVTYTFDFARGPHIALMEELDAAVRLFSRRQLRLDLQHQLGVELDP